MSQRRFLLALSLMTLPVSAKVATIGSCPYTITAPGQYHLAQDLVCTGFAAITISSDNVELHLDSHTISGNAFYGVYAVGSNESILGQGAINAFEFGIWVQGSGNRIVNVNASAFIGINVVFSDNATVLNCSTSGTGAPLSIGIQVLGSQNASLISNIATSFDTGIALLSSRNNMVRSNKANSNTTSGILADNNSGENQFQSNFVYNNATDLLDLNAACGTDTWKGNHFGTANPATCIQ